MFPLHRNSPESPPQQPVEFIEIRKEETLEPIQEYDFQLGEIKSIPTDAFEQNDPLCDKFRTSCIQCHRIFTSEKFLTQHIQKEHQEKKSSEINCSSKTKFKSNFKAQHYQCKVCDEIITSSIGYLSHLKMHAAQTPGIEALKLRTEASPKMYTRRVVENPSKNLGGIIKSEEPGEKRRKIDILENLEQTNFQCDLCESSFDDENKLSSHLEVHRKPVGFRTTTREIRSEEKKTNFLNEKKIMTENTNFEKESGSGASILDVPIKKENEEVFVIDFGEISNSNKPSSENEQNNEVSDSQIYIDKPFRMEVKDPTQEGKSEAKEINSKKKTILTKNQKLDKVSISKENFQGSIICLEGSNSSNQIYIIQPSQLQIKETPEKKSEVNFSEERTISRTKNLERNSQSEVLIINEPIEEKSQFPVINLDEDSNSNNPTSENEKNSNDTWNTCEFCPLRFQGKAALEMHCKTHSSLNYEFKKFTCEICGYTFKTERYFNWHMKRHTRVNDKKEVDTDFKERDFICNIYKDTLHSSKMKSMNSIDCDQCDQEFQSQESLKIHTRDAHQEGEKNSDKMHEILKKPLKCKICHALCKTLFLKKCHVDKHKGVENPYACDKCDERFSKGSGFLDHYDRKHKPKIDFDRPFVCSICNTSFFLEAALKRHSLKEHCISLKRNIQNC